MTLMEVLKGGRWRDLRVVNGDRWMIWDDMIDKDQTVTKGAWIVYDYNYERDKTQIIITTGDEELAVKYLLYKEDEK